MALLRNILHDQDRIHSIANIDTFFEDNGLPDNAMIQAFHLDKKTFKDKAAAVDWIDHHYFYVDNIEEAEGFFIFTQLDPSEFQPNAFGEKTTFKTVDFGNGVNAVVGVLRAVDFFERPSEMFLSLRNDEGINLTGGKGSTPHIIELAKVVQGFHPTFGEIIITEDTLLSFKKNFDDKVLGIDIRIDYEHDKRKAAGWIKEVFLSLDKDILFGVVNWTPKGALALSDKEFRYFSPEYSLNFTHPHTGEEFGATLKGGALTNNPFLRMEAIVALNENKTGKEIENMDTIKLSEHKGIVSELEKKILGFQLSEQTAKTTIDGQKVELDTVKAENIKLKDEAEKSKKIQLHEKLFAANKINKAQLDAMNDGKDLLDVLSLSENVNLEGNGEGGNGEGDTITLSDEAKLVCTRLGLSHEDYVKYNK